MLDSADLVQHVKGSTHRRGHTLDVIITRKEENILTDVNILEEFFSDHKVVCCKLDHTKPQPSKVFVTYRPTKTVDIAKLKGDINDAFSDIDLSTQITVDEKVISYNDSLKTIYDAVAPVQSRWVTHRPQALWYNEDLRQLKREKRRLERKLKKTGLTVDQQIFESKCSEYSTLLESSKRNYFKSKIEQAGRNHLFRLVNSLFAPNKNIFPSNDNFKNLGEDFNSFFLNKIRDIRLDLQDVSASYYETETRQLDCEFSAFDPPSNEVIKQAITSFSNKTCFLDPIPTHIVKDNVISLLPCISTIVRQSFSCGIFPTTLKASLVQPKLKKPDLDPNILTNYRPISNIPFLSKVIEKSAATQVHNYLNNNNLFPNLQSAYRKHYSTETALLKVNDDILKTLDSNGEIILVLLDLSAAFDTLDHKLLLDRLHSYFNFRGTVLKWFSSYLIDRCQSVKIGNVTSSSQRLEHGVPQGSILGPLLFTLYMAPLEDVIHSHNLSCMFYADDTQIYIAINNNGQSVNSLDILRTCVEDVFTWNAKNKLKSNPSKTEVLHFTSRFKKNPTLCTALKLGDTDISVKTKARNLGVIMDKTLSFTEHINEVCKKANFGIRSIGRIRKYLPQDDLKTLVNSLVISRLDYCNSLLYNIPKYQKEKLQRVQNVAARMLTGARRNDHITPILKKLHWLPIEARIDFKILLITYKILNGQSAAYLTPLIQEYHPSRSLRSSTQHQLLTPTTKTKTYGGRAYSNSAPQLWNSLPKDIKTAESTAIFKSKLKTFLFRKHFN